MNSYKLILKDKNIFYALIKNFGAADKFKEIILQEVIVTPEINSWKIKFHSPENFDEKILRNAEIFLSQKFSADVKLFAEKIPAVEKIAVENISGDKIFGKKISEPITEISKLMLDRKSVVVGEISGIDLREFKTGSCAITFSLADDSDGIFCKKFFQEKSRAKADELKKNLRDGMKIKIYGAVKFDEYLKDKIFMFDGVEEIKITERMDNAKIKRTELHAHTTMSMMDAVVSAEKLITTAANWNWKSIIRRNR